MGGEPVPVDELAPRHERADVRRAEGTAEGDDELAAAVPLRVADGRGDDRALEAGERARALRRGRRDAARERPPVAAERDRVSLRQLPAEEPHRRGGGDGADPERTHAVGAGEHLEQRAPLRAGDVLVEEEVAEARRDDRRAAVAADVDDADRLDDVRPLPPDDVGAPGGEPAARGACTCGSVAGTYSVPPWRPTVTTSASRRARCTARAHERARSTRRPRASAARRAGPGRSRRTRAARRGRRPTSTILGAYAAAADEPAAEGGELRPRRAPHRVGHGARTGVARVVVGDRDRVEARRGEERRGRRPRFERVRAEGGTVRARASAATRGSRRRDRRRRPRRGRRRRALPGRPPRPAPHPGRA